MENSDGRYLMPNTNFGGRTFCWAVPEKCWQGERRSVDDNVAPTTVFQIKTLLCLHNTWDNYEGGGSWNKGDHAQPSSSQR